MKLYENKPLKGLNTFGMAYLARTFLELEKIEDLYKLKNIKADQKLQLIAGGSNIVFTCDYNGIIAKPLFKGIKIEQNSNFFYITVAAAENWHELVCYCLENKIYGLENLALIPGEVGAAPIQNIGAYGIEFKDVCNYVEYFDLDLGEIVRLNKHQCQFTYRNSIFKNELKDNAIIINVQIKLPKAWIPILTYAPLDLLPNNVTAQQIFDTVCQCRYSKLPDPLKIGNVGSFFENPIITKEQFLSIKQRYPKIIGYPMQNSIKLAAAWLIDNADLKGFTIGKCQVSKTNALVLENQGGATGTDICNLIQHILSVIWDKYNIQLIVEPKILGADSEINF